MPAYATCPRPRPPRLIPDGHPCQLLFSKEICSSVRAHLTERHSTHNQISKNTGNGQWPRKSPEWTFLISEWSNKALPFLLVATQPMGRSGPRSLFCYRLLATPGRHAPVPDGVLSSML